MNVSYSSKWMSQVLKYIFINAGFIVTGFLLSSVINFAGAFGFDHAHDMGLGNMLLTTSGFAILGFAYSGYKCLSNRILVVLSIISIIGILLFLNSLSW